MSQETEGSSPLSERTKKKKKYLYLDKFENHVMLTRARHLKIVRDMWINRILIILMILLLTYGVTQL